MPKHATPEPLPARRPVNKSNAANSDAQSRPHVDLSRADLLALQRTLGNQAVQRMIQRGTLPAITRADPAIQRVVDLEKTYTETEQLPKEVLQNWLPRFKSVQDLLNNKSLVDKHLQTLGAYIAQNKVSVSAALEHYQSGTWTGARPILTDFVSATMFSSVVSKGQLFEDLVGESHGIQTHRIQWYIIGQELGGNEALALYQEATKQRWARFDKSVGSEKRMWDYIVDGLGGQAQEFTTPDKLEAYLVQNAPFFYYSKWTDLNWVGNDIKGGHNDQKKRKAEMIGNYPPEDEFTETLKNAVEEHKSVLKKRDEEKSYKQQVTYQQQAAKIVQDIETERVVYKNYTWTGWITSDGSQAQSASKTDLPYFVPSVAYPMGHDPDESK